MAKKRKKYTKKQAKFWASVIVAVIAALMQQNGKPVDTQADMPSAETLKNVGAAKAIFHLLTVETSTISS